MGSFFSTCAFRTRNASSENSKILLALMINGALILYTFLMNGMILCLSPSDIRKCRGWEIDLNSIPNIVCLQKYLFLV